MVDRAAVHAIDTLDEQLFKGWHKRGMQLVSALETGLNKIDFGTPLPEEIVQLQALIKQAKQPDMLNERKQLLSTISEIGKNLESLQQKKDLGDLQANNFLFQASRTFNRFSKPHRLNLFLINQFFKYGKAFVNPSNKPSEKSEKDPMPAMADFVLNKGTKFGVKQIDGIFDYHVGSFFERQAHSMHSVKLNNIVDRPEKKSAPQFLATQLGSTNYANFQKTKSMSGVNDIEKMLSEKIYGFSYEFYYSQVAMYLDTLHQVEQIASLQQTDTQRRNTRASLLKKHGIEAIDSSEGKIFLNAISKNLGFSDAQSLYDNYKELPKNPAAVEKLMAEKNKFSDFAVNPEGFKEQDPIDLIKGLYENEYQRIQKNKKNNEFYLNNSTYISALNYVSTDFMLAIDGVRKARNIAGVAIHDEVAPLVEGQNAGFLMNMAKNAANFAVNNLNIKDWVDINQYLGLNSHGALVEARIEDARNHVQQQLLELRAQQVAMRQQLREKLFNEVISEKITQEQLIVNYEKSTVGKTESEKRDYQSAFEVKIALNCQGKNSEALEKLVDKHKRGLKSATSLHNEYKKEQLVLKKRKEKFEKKEASSSARMSRFKDNIASLFGVKTKSAKKREKETKYLESQTDKIIKGITSIEARVEGYTKVLGMTKEQLSNLKRIESLDEKTLIKEYKENINLLSNLIRGLVSEYQEKPSIDYEKMLEIQHKYFAIQNKILLDKKVIVSRVSKFDIEQIDQLIASTNNLNTIQKSIKPQLLGLTSQVAEFYGQKINGYAPVIIEQRNHLEEQRQQELLEKHKSSTQAWMSSNNITDLKTFLVENRPKDLSESYLQKYDQSLQKEIMQKFKSDGHNLSLDKITLLHEGISALHFMSPDVEIYNNIRAELNTRLDEAYLSGTQAGFDSHRKLLINSSQFIASGVKKLEKAQQDAEGLKATYESWLMNPFGFVTKQKLDEASANVETYQSILNDKLNRNIEVTQQYIANQMQVYHKKPIVDLEADIALIEKKVAELQQLPKENLDKNTAALVDNLIDLNESLLVNLNDQHSTYFEKLLDKNEPVAINLLSQSFVHAAKNGRVDLLEKIVQQADHNAFPEIMLTQALEQAIQNKHTDVINWMLSNIDLSLDEKLSSDLLSHIDSSQTKISPYETGLGQIFVDNDGNVLEKIRQAYILQETNQAILNKDITENKQNTVSLNIAMAKLNRIISHREQMVDALSKVRIDNPDRVKKQVAKWDAEIENNPEGNTSTLIMSALNKSDTIDNPIPTFEEERDISTNKPIDISMQAVAEKPDEVPMAESIKIAIDENEKINEKPPIAPVVEKVELKPEVDQQANIDFKEKYLDLKASLMDHVTKRPWEVSKFKLLLSELRDLQQGALPEMKHDFNNAMTKLVEKLTKKSEIEGLEVAIEFISEPEKQKEAIHHALIHAVQLGKVDVLKVLLQKNIDFSENNQRLANQVMENLIAIYNEKEKGMMKPKHIQLPKVIAQLMPLLPLSYDEKMHELMNFCIKEERNGHNYPIETGTWQRWVADSDKPILEEYRSAYLFQQKILKDLVNDSDYEFRMPMDNLLIDKLISEFTPDEIKKYQDMADSFQQKVNTIEEKLQAFKKEQLDYLENNTKGKLQNADRLKNHLGNWDVQFEKVIKSQLAEVQSNINHVKKELAEYQPENKLLSDKKEILFGYAASSAESVSDKNILEEPKKKNVNKLSSSSGQG